MEINKKLWEIKKTIYNIMSTDFFMREFYDIFHSGGPYLREVKRHRLFHNEDEVKISYKSDPYLRI